MPGLRAGTPTARAVCRAIQLPMWMLLLPWRGVGAARRSAMKQGAKLSLWEGFFFVVVLAGLACVDHVCCPHTAVHWRQVCAVLFEEFLPWSVYESSQLYPQESGGGGGGVVVGVKDERPMGCACEQAAVRHTGGA